jgi:predicted DNA-binding transcriptional regulator YafY
MSLPTSRLLAALELLQARQRVTGPELAARLGVDVRTARRYVTRLVAMGVPVSSERGRDGAYHLATGFKLPPMMFTDEEALALGIGLMAARGLGLNTSSVAVEGALLKLERVMPTGLRATLRAASRAVELGLHRPKTNLQGKVLAVLTVAIEKQQRVQLQYQAQEASATLRSIDPWGLAHYAGHWYVVGYCHLRSGQRSFRLDRITSATPEPASFAPPASFDALTALLEGIGALPRTHQVQVELAAGLDQVRRHISLEIGALTPLTGERAPRVLLTSQVDDLDWMARELARLPFDFTVRQPAALSSALHALADRIHRLTGQPGEQHTPLNARPTCGKGSDG